MKGATYDGLIGPIRYAHFNPRTHEGCDVFFILSFISSDYFNPRTHEGCDSLQINSVIACFSIIYIAN